MNKLKNSDRASGKFVAVASSVFLDKTRSGTVREQIRIIKEAMFIFRQILDLPDNLTVRLAFIKKRNRMGTYYNGDNIAEVESRRGSHMDLLRTLAHELVHAEQYKTGRLKSEWVPRVGYVQQWYGEAVKNKGATYRSYRKQPWEVEAFDRQDGLAKFVGSLIGVK